MGGRPQGGHDGRGTGTARGAASLAAGVHRRASRAMWLLHVGNADQRGGAARAHAATHRNRSQASARSQSLPLRQLQPGRARGPARGRDAGRRMNLAFNLARGAVAGTPLPGSLRVNRRLAQWLRFHVEGYVEVFSGKVEIGQGILTALAQIAAEELDLSLEQLRMVPASTAISPDEAITSGSLSVQESGTALRHACAEARAIYLNAAAARLGAPIETLHVDNGRIVSTGGGETTYWELIVDDLLDRDATGQVAPKPASAHRVVGTAVARLDLNDKVFGAPCFIHDLELPRMLHGRVLRPPSADATLLDLDAAKVRALPDVFAVVRDGSFVGVLADSEAGAEAALKELAAGRTCPQSTSLPDEASMATWLMAQEAETSIVDSKATATPRPIARTMKARYSRPYIAHGSLGRSCALAQELDSGLRGWTQ